MALTIKRVSRAALLAFLAASVIGSLTAAVFADEQKAHKINFKATLIDEDRGGAPLCSTDVASDGKCARPWTLALVARIALNSPTNNGQNVTPETRDRRGELAHSLVGASEISLLDSDLKDLKTCIGNVFMPTIVHQAWRMLDGKPPLE